jgi:NAD(P)-dependent dehydrogenase (short-subunit alcohol dehydrogenase family)
MMLTDKVAVIYGASGEVGGAVARAFAREGRRFSHRAQRHTGQGCRHGNRFARRMRRSSAGRRPLRTGRGGPSTVGGRFGGSCRYSFNSVGIPNVQILGVPLIELDLEHFSQPIASYTQSYFLTARLAARRMIPRKSGVIMTLTALHSRTGLPLVGGYGPAMAAKEALTRDHSAELAPHGIRVVGLRPQGMPETRTIRDAFESSRQGNGDDLGTVAGIPGR